MPSIQNFRSYLNKYNDVARADRFKVFIIPPTAILPFGYSQATEKLSFQCEAAELPGRSLATFDARTYGPNVKYPYQTIYNDLNLTFFCTANKSSSEARTSLVALNNNNDVKGTGLWEKRFFDNWMDKINPSQITDTVNTPSYNMEYKENYQSIIEVVHYDVNDAETYSVKFMEAFPTAVNQLSLSWADESVLRLTVTFSYTRWEISNDAKNNIEGTFEYESAALATKTNFGKNIISGIIDKITNIF